MTWMPLAKSVLYLGLLVLLAIPLGAYMARVYSGNTGVAQRVLGPIERLFYRLAGVDPNEEMTWQRYAGAVLVFNLLGVLAVYALQRMQHVAPLNPARLPAVPPELSFNTAVSFATNTNWQAYSGETTLSYLTQMLGLGVENFLSAATSMAVLVAVVRGLARQKVEGLGSFWVDVTRTTLYVLLPLSCVFSLFLVSQGVVQTLGSYASAHLLVPTTGANGVAVTEQVIALGPAASQVAIKQIGTNGGGFFNVNSAHPFENPTALSSWGQMLFILLIPAALCFTFGAMIRDRRQGRAIFAAMLLILVPFVGVTIRFEQAGNPVLSSLGVDQTPTALQSGGNMEGKETRFGAVESAIWSTASAATSNGSVNSMNDSFTPVGGLVPLWLIQLGEVVFGGVGSGLYGMFLYVIVTVFAAGLMVGRMPAYLGKKVEAFELKMAMLAILLPTAAILVGTAIACLVPAGAAAVGNPGPHGFSEILYAFSSASNNNGSAFGGITVSGVFYTIALGICILIGRYCVIIPVLALAGSLARKESAVETVGTLRTHSPLFVLLLAFTVLIVGALTFFPALSLGPILEHLSLPVR